jgi:type I restriction enzyme S subunit
VNTVEFKDSPVGRIPVDWDVVKLEDVVEIHDNKRIPLSEKERINRKGDYPYCGANGVIDYIDDYIFDGEFLLLAEDGGDYSSFGRSAYLMNGKFWVNNHAHIIEAIHSKTTNKFLLYTLTYLNLNHYTVGSTRKKLNQSIMRKIKLPLPPLEEQKRISEILLDVDSAIENVNKAIDVTEELKRGLMQRLLMEGINHTEFKDSPVGGIPVDWDVVRVLEVFDVVTGTTPSTKLSEFWDDGNVVWITPADMSDLNGIFISDSERKVTVDALKKTNLNRIPVYSIVISTRAPVGYVALNTVECTFNQGCKALVPSRSGIDTRYFAYYLLLNNKRLQHLSGGSTFKELNKETLKKIYLPLPPLEEQKRISEILQDVDRRLELLRERKVKLENIKRGLMNDLLTGKRRVRITS